MITLLLVPVLIVASSGIQYLSRRQMDTEDKRIAVIDRTGVLYADLLKLAEKRNETEVYDRETGKKVKAAFLLESIPPSPDAKADVDQQRLELSQRVLKGDFFGFVDIGPDMARLLDWKT